MLTQVSTTVIADGSIATTKLADGAVTSAKIGAGAVLAAAVAPGAVTQAKVADGTAGTGPAFSDFRSTTAQTVTSGVTTKVQLNGEDFDTAAAFDSTTNFRFLPTVAGYYQISGRVAANASTAGTVAVAYLYKNNAMVISGQSYIPPSGSSSMVTTVSGLVYLNGTTDYLELFASITGTGTCTILAGTGVTFMQGALVRAG